MDTEQLKKAAFKATPGPWFSMPICEVSQWVDVVARDKVGRYSLPFVACKHFDSEANAALIAAANPATILALLECVDALRMAVQQNDHDMLMTGEELRQCRAALQKLEAL